MTLCCPQRVPRASQGHQEVNSEASRIWAKRKIFSRSRCSSGWRCLRGAVPIHKFPAISSVCLQTGGDCWRSRRRCLPAPQSGDAHNTVIHLCSPLPEPAHSYPDSKGPETGGVPSSGLREVRALERGLTREGTSCGSPVSVLSTSSPHPHGV